MNNTIKNVVIFVVGAATGALIAKDVESVIKAIDETILNGKDVLQYIKDITKHFRNLLMVKISKSQRRSLMPAKTT
jgi:DNA polymerase-3 subunit gamma/tau